MVWPEISEFYFVDDYNREALAIEIDLNLPAQRIIRVMDRIALWRGYPAKIRIDNGRRNLHHFGWQNGLKTME